MKALVINPTGKASTKRKKGKYLHRPTVYTKKNRIQEKFKMGKGYYINPQSPEMKRAHAFLSVIIEGLNKTKTVEIILNQHDKQTLKYILKNI